MFNDRSEAVLLLWIFLLFMSPVCHAFLSVHCSLVITCQERPGKASLLALLFVMLHCVFLFTFPSYVLGQVCYLIVSISHLASLLTLLFELTMLVCSKILQY